MQGWRLNIRCAGVLMYTGGTKTALNDHKGTVVVVLIQTEVKYLLD